MQLTRACGKHLRDNGIDQWDENYPDRGGILHDLNSKTLFAYREGDELLGIVVLNEFQEEEYGEINWSTSTDDKNIIVYRLVIRSDQQGKGIGRKLMDFAEQWSRENTYDAITKGVGGVVYS